jgi:hypothetical protein
MSSDQFLLVISLVQVNKSKPGTLGDRWKPMTIQPNVKIGIGYQCHRVADANFAVGDQNFIGYLTDATNGTR